MLRHLILIGAILTSSATAAPHSPDARRDHVERDWSSLSVWPHPSPTWASTGWGSWIPSTYSHSYQPSTTQVATSSVTTQQPTAPSSTASITSVTSVAATPTGPCGSVAQLAAAFTNLSPSATPTVPAQLAFECLNSIPFNQSAAIQFLDSIDPYLNWQTTFEYLKDPPADYAEKVQPPYDFYATWEAIKANTSAGAYQSEYEFGWTVYRAAQLAHDGHFVFYTDSVTSLFSFGRSFPLVSVSLDGVSDPQPYLYSDIVNSLGGDTSFTPSPVVQIDGQDAVQYLLVWSEYGSLQDPDALWNNLFWEPAQIALASQGTGVGTFGGGGRGRWPYPGPSTTLKFANGTTVTQENHANVLMPFDNITSGEDVYQYFLVPPAEAYQNAFQSYSSASATASATASGSASISTLASATSGAASSTMAASTSSAAPSSIPSPGYPTPFVSETSNLNAGYFIDAPGYEDVAVLVVRSFVGSDEELPFQAVNTYFIETAAAMGKTKLIVDVSANGGGTILQGYDLFKQLFPSILPYEGNRWRAHEAFNLLGEQSSYVSGLYPRSLNNSDAIVDIEASSFNYRTDLDENYQPFTSWAEKYGPDVLGPQPDNFSSIERWNLSDVLTPYNSGGIDVSGYLNRTNITAQPFTAENIIIVTDGYCASTCTIFSELMVQQGGVKTVALGGRPGTGIMQAIGGVKGTNDYPFDVIFESIGETYGASNASLQSQWDTSVLSQYTQLPIYRSTDVVLNVRNGYRRGNDTPLQFVYEPADCRILYTPAMIVDETAVWKTVADSVWGGGAGDACIAGGIGTDSMKRSAKTKKGLGKRKLHEARQGVDYDAILDSFSVQSKNTDVYGGSGIMIV